MADTSQETASQNQAPQLDPYLAERAAALESSIGAAFEGATAPNAHVAHELEGVAVALGTMATASGAGAHELNEGDKATKAGVLRAFGALAELGKVPHRTRVQTPRYSDPDRRLAVDVEINGSQATHRALQYSYLTQFEGSEEEPALDVKFLEIADALIDRTADDPRFLHGLLFIGMHGWARIDRRERTEYIASFLDESPVEHILAPARQAMSALDRFKQQPLIGRVFKLGGAALPSAVETARKHGSKLVGAFTERGRITQGYMEARAQEQAEAYLHDQELADGRYAVEHVLEGIQLALPELIPLDRINVASDYTALVKAIALRLPLRMPEMFIDPNASNRAKQIAFFAMRSAATDLVERPDYSVLQQADAKAAAAAQAPAQGPNKKKK